MEPQTYLAIAVIIALIAMIAMTAWNDYNMHEVIAGVPRASVSGLNHPKETLVKPRTLTIEDLAAHNREFEKVWDSINNNSIKIATTELDCEKAVRLDIDILKQRVSDLEKKLKLSATPKVVHVTHQYATPMQVDLTYPERAPQKLKGKGRAGLLERSRQ